MRSDDYAVLNKIIGYCEDVTLLMNKYDNSFEKYQNDISFQYSCNMCLIQIGELVGRLSDEFIEIHTDVPWHAIKGMRNLHAHDYENVDLEIVWTTLKEDIPSLREQLLEMI